MAEKGKRRFIDEDRPEYKDLNWTRTRKAPIEIREVNSDEEAREVLLEAMRRSEITRRGLGESRENPEKRLDRLFELRMVFERLRKDKDRIAKLYLPGWERSSAGSEDTPVSPSQVVALVAEEISFITVSREYGCQALGFAQKLAEALSKEEGKPWRVLSRQLLEEVRDHLKAAKAHSAKGNGQSAALGRFLKNVTTEDVEKINFDDLADLVRAEDVQGRCILVGLGGMAFTQVLAKGIHIRLAGSLDYRIMQIMGSRNCTRYQAEKEVRQNDVLRKDFWKYLKRQYRVDGLNSEAYDLVLRGERLTEDERLNQVLQLYRSRRDETLSKKTR